MHRDSVRVLRRGRPPTFHVLWDRDPSSRCIASASLAATPKLAAWYSFSSTVAGPGGGWMVGGWRGPWVV
jgi:hypothetical protein